MPHFKKEGITQAHTVEVGSRLYIESELSGHPAPTLRYQLNGQPLKPELGVLTGTEGGKVFIEIKTVTEKHAGVYTVIAENQAGGDVIEYTVNVTGRYKHEGIYTVIAENQAGGDVIEYTVNVTGRYKHEGIYTVIAENQAGRDVIEYTVNVTGSI